MVKLLSVDCVKNNLYESRMKIPLCLSLYHLILMVTAGFLSFKMTFYSKEIPSEWIHVLFFGFLGGVIYCIRGIYIQYCAKKEWDNRWILWHIVRPFVSLVAGGMSLVFIKAGLLIFTTTANEIDRTYTVYALAFLAGLNVDNFMRKIESVFNEILGIENSNLTKKNK